MIKIKILKESIKFKTSKGSEYTVLGNTTERVKAQRKEHGSDFGKKKQSELTVYIKPSQALEFGSMQSLSPVESFVVQVKSNTVRLLYKSYGKWKVGVNWISFKNEPQIGLSPLELWEKIEEAGEIGYKRWHPGNEIINIGD